MYKIFNPIRVNDKNNMYIHKWNKSWPTIRSKIRISQIVTKFLRPIENIFVLDHARYRDKKRFVFSYIFNYICIKIIYYVRGVKIQNKKSAFENLFRWLLNILLYTRIFILKFGELINILVCLFFLGDFSRCSAERSGKALSTRSTFFRRIIFRKSLDD